MFTVTIDQFNASLFNKSISFRFFFLLYKLLYKKCHTFNEFIYEVKIKKNSLQV